MDAIELFLADKLTNCRTTKWTPLVMYLLRDGQPQRYAQLKRQIDGISQKMLTQTLRQLEQQDLVTRTVYPTVPSTVEYQLTPLSLRMLQPFLKMMEFQLPQPNEPASSVDE